MDVHIQEVEESVPIRVVAGVRVRRRHKGRWWVEREVAVGLRRGRVAPEVYRRRCILIELEVNEVRPVDSGCIDRGAWEGNSDRSRPYRQGGGGGTEQREVKGRIAQESGHRVVAGHVDLDVDVHIQEVEESVPIRVFARVGVRRRHEGRWWVEREVAVGLRRVAARVDDRVGFVQEKQVDRIGSIDTGRVDGPSLEPDRYDRRPHREERGRRVVEVQDIAWVMEGPSDCKIACDGDQEAYVDQEEVEQAVP